MKVDKDASLFASHEGNSELLFSAEPKAAWERTSTKFHQLITYFELNPETKVIQMTVYSVFDFMRDLGGLLALAILVCSFMNSLFSFNKLENSLVE